MHIRGFTNVLHRSKISDFSFDTKNLSSGLIRNSLCGWVSEFIFTTNGSRKQKGRDIYKTEALLIPHILQELIIVIYLYS